MLVTEALEAELGALAGSGRSVEREELQRAEAADRIALHLGRTIERALGALPEKERVGVATALAREVVELVVRSTDAAGLGGQRPVEPGGVLRSIRALLPDGRAEPVAEPLIPLLDTTLLTNAPGEPRIGSQIEAEIHSADSIDVVMAFIRRSGSRPLLEALPQRLALKR